MSTTTDSALEKVLPASAENSDIEAVSKEIPVSGEDGKQEEQEYAWNPGYTSDYSIEDDKSDEDDSSVEEAIRRCGSDIDSEDFVHAADRAEHLEDLPLSKQVCVLSHLSPEEAADALAELDEEMASDVLESMDADDAAQIIAEMDPDDAVDILEEVDEDHRDILLSNLPQEDAEQLRNLLSFDPDTAAGVMNTEIIMAPFESTVDEAIQLIRSELEEKEMPYYVYVVDDREVLKGVVSLRDLMLARPGTPMEDMVGRQDVISVQFDADKTEVARELAHYNFICLPVVDREEHLMGVITHDDVLDIVLEEASSDMLGMVGAGQDETVDTPWTRSVNIRLPWLIINMCTSSLSAFIVSLFEGSIAEMALLAVLMPMVANQAGNTGQQALAVMIRQLATESFDSKRSWGAVVRESKIGFGTGIVMALLAYLGVLLLSSNNLLAFVMGFSLLLDMFLGAIAGGAETFMSKGKAQSLDAKLAKATKWFALAFVLLTLILNLI
ncbi:MAG: magnesium transporter [Mailhella sp.]|nr:magnesium transporter [Mailhella sp.]